jgi:hypothetical protein
LHCKSSKTGCLQQVVLKDSVPNGPGPNSLDPRLGLLVVCRVDVPTHTAFKIMDDRPYNCGLTAIAQFEETLCKYLSHYRNPL